MGKAPTAVVVCPEVPHPPQTGGQKRTLRLLEAAQRAGVTPHILTPDPNASLEREALESRGWRLDAVHEPSPSLWSRARQHLARRPSPYLANLAARLRELIDVGPAWVQLEHGQSAYYLDLLVGRRRLLSLHNLDSDVLRSFARAEPIGIARLRAEVRWRAMCATERRAAPLAELVVCVSEQDRVKMERLGARTLLVPNGVDRELFEIPPAPQQEPLVLFFGQLRYEPNHRGVLRFLADGWPHVTAVQPRARLRIVGEGADEVLRQAAQAAPGAELIGLVPSITSELARASVVVVPIWEGGGTRLKVLEAMGAARPVVGTPLGVSGIGFVDGRHGRIVDDPEGLGLAIAELLALPDRRRAAGQAGRELARAYSWERVLAPLESVYERWAHG